MSGVLSTAVSGLRASQNALNTTGHNISNANTDGYSRQDIQFETRPAQFSGAGFIGAGVNTASIERVVNEFLITQLRLDSSAFNELDTFNNQIGKIDSMLADPNTGLSQGFQSFFASLQNAADDPTSIPSRQLVLTEADSLVSRFGTLHDRLKSVNDGLNQELSTAVAQINALSASIANLNDSISLALGKGQGDSPNDLLDQRDETVRQLAELVSLSVVEQTDGKLNVFVGTGQPLVVGSNVTNISLAAGEEDPQRKEIVLVSNGSEQVITTLMGGGTVGGLLDFRDSVLDPTFNDLGRMAIVLTETMNEIQHQGLDLEGNFGTSFFSDINDPVTAANRVLSSAGNLPPDDRLISVEILDTSKMTVDDYKFSIEPNSNRYSITRQGSNELVVQGVITGAYPAAIEFDGLRLNLVSGSFQSGDDFLLQPTRSGAADINLEITRSAALAFADPISTGKTAGNIGSGTISQGQMLSALDANGQLLTAFSTAGQLTVPLLIKFTSSTTFDVLDNSNPASPAQLVPPLRNQSYTPGVNNTLFTNDPGQTLASGLGSNLGSLSAVPGPYNNGLPAETITFARVDPITGGITSSLVNVPANLSAKEAATLISSNAGISATAFTKATFGDVRLEDPTLAQITLNGVNLIDATDVPVSPILAPVFPATSTPEQIAFNDYLAQKINSDPALALQGISAVSGQSATGRAELRLISTSGEDLQLEFDDGFAGLGTGQSIITLSDERGGHQDIRHNQGVVVGGVLDVTMADGISMTTDLEIPVAATLTGTANAAGLLANIGAAGPNDYDFNITVDGVASNAISLTPGAYSLATLATQIETQINADAALTTAGKSVTVTHNGTAFVVTSTATGVTSSVDSFNVVGPNAIELGLHNGTETFGSSPRFGAIAAQSSFLGYQVTLNGRPETNDSFTVNYNDDGSSDNRNALRFASVESKKLLSGGQSITESYATLVETVGTESNLSRINREASKSLLEQTQSSRDSISGVNLDEEAARLIQFEQLYNANARVISVARDLFDTLLSSVG